jgi:hypothetical protein
LTAETFDLIADEPIRDATDPTLDRKHPAATEAKLASQLVRLGS